MEERMLWLMGLYALFFAFGLWCGWAMWRRPTLTYKPGDWIDP